MIQLKEVAKSYRRGAEEVAALRSTSFTVNPGEFVAVIGPSGSGKTTLLSILGGMLAPTNGQVWFSGQSLYDAPADTRAVIRQRHVGFVFQTFNLVPYLTALENVQVPLVLAGVSPDRQGQIARELLVRMGLAERINHKPAELSVGQQQRVALARTLVNDPKVILADEPTGNLDPETRGHVLGFLGELSRAGRTVVMVTHDPTAAACANRVIRLAEGALVDDRITTLQMSA